MSRSLLLTVEEGAKQASISRAKMFALIKAGEVRSIKIGRSRRIPAIALEEYVNRLLQEQSRAAA
ncbi:excisionase family DNA-binding protein [Actinoplanes teichomyceticus]|uniref:Excisionase family DNA binding protein n=1 Tax=Actinoplanes teichomyceticus TaxID=1867 RepID=A0A561WI70_ACTTI|nr:excisionase family DNA-binding protein [Actinoplanes teichomyceticus]TWG23577.1 excisionase family DNA binding protein [Actinoplanes teichomyceticus]